VSLFVLFIVLKYRFKQLSATLRSPVACKYWGIVSKCSVMCQILLWNV